MQSMLKQNIISAFNIFVKYFILLSVFFFKQGYDRAASQQAGYQLLGIGVTILVAIVGGILAGKCIESQ